MDQPILFVFTGTSGSGRKTIAHVIGERFNLAHVISCTTRQPRHSVKSVQQDYHYLNHEAFEEEASNGQFLQIVTIDRERYGVRERDLDVALSGDQHVYLILNREGAAEFKRRYGDRVVRLFIYVDKQTVRERLESKGMAYDVLQHYLDHYTEEVTYRKECEHVVQNIELKKTLAELSEIVGGYVGQ